MEKSIYNSWMTVHGKAEIVFRIWHDTLLFSPGSIAGVKSSIIGLFHYRVCKNMLNSLKPIPIEDVLDTVGRESKAIEVHTNCFFDGFLTHDVLYLAVNPLTNLIELVCLCK